MSQRWIFDTFDAYKKKRKRKETLRTFAHTCQNKEAQIHFSRNLCQQKGQWLISGKGHPSSLSMVDPPSIFNRLKMTLRTQRCVYTPFLVLGSSGGKVIDWNTHGRRWYGLTVAAFHRNIYSCNILFRTRTSSCVDARITLSWHNIFTPGWGQHFFFFFLQRKRHGRFKCKIYCVTAPIRLNGNSWVSK